MTQTTLAPQRSHTSIGTPFCSKMTRELQKAFSLLLLKKYFKTMFTCLETTHKKDIQEIREGSRTCISNLTPSHDDHKAAGGTVNAMQLGYAQAQFDNAKDQPYRNNIHLKGIPEAMSKVDPKYTTCSIFIMLLFRSSTDETEIDQAHRASVYKIPDSTFL